MRQLFLKPKNETFRIIIETLFLSGQPKVRLSARPRITPIEAEEVSDEVCLTWAPCSKHDKSYEVEMWDLGKNFFFYTRNGHF